MLHISRHFACGFTEWTIAVEIGGLVWTPAQVLPQEVMATPQSHVYLMYEGLANDYTLSNLNSNRIKQHMPNPIKHHMEAHWSMWLDKRYVLLNNRVFITFSYKKIKSGFEICPDSRLAKKAAARLHR